MAAFTHAIYIDESGNGAPVSGIQSYWVTAAIALPFSILENLDFDAKSLLSRFFRPGEKELKGKDMPNHLQGGISIDDVMNAVAGIIVGFNANVWISYAHNDWMNSKRSDCTERLMTKALSRRTMFELINNDLNADKEGIDQYLIVWDIPDQQELEDFSRSITAFRNEHSGKWLNPRLASAILGGLSHDWSALQIADLVAHCAIHEVGTLSRMSDANPIKALSFRSHIEPICRMSGTLLRRH